jgi:hypothetical protein
VDFAALVSKASKAVLIAVHAVAFASLSVVCSRMYAAGSTQQGVCSRKCASGFRGQCYGNGLVFVQSTAPCTQNPYQIRISVNP